MENSVILYKWVEIGTNEVKKAIQSAECVGVNYAEQLGDKVFDYRYMKVFKKYKKMIDDGMTIEEVAETTLSGENPNDFKIFESVIVYWYFFNNNDKNKYFMKAVRYLVLNYYGILFTDAARKLINSSLDELEEEIDKGEKTKLFYEENLDDLTKEKYILILNIIISVKKLERKMILNGSIGVKELMKSLAEYIEKFYELDSVS
ncbi:hypothetical protein [Clostridium sp.]|uniref:hypothetical protein n=1 Tax=Clostridium sp. TaxID=1506 RepID=UPI001B5ACFAE|nr:hypothetical protein [Clostridium sp.]MBP3915288.1 hypothetical protein [Clostridium sp.]